MMSGIRRMEKICLCRKQLPTGLEAPQKADGFCAGFWSAERDFGGENIHRFIHRAERADE